MNTLEMLDRAQYALKNGLGHIARDILTLVIEQLEKQKAVAIIQDDNDGNQPYLKRLQHPLPPVGTKLYAAPVRTKDLTPDELFSIANKVGFDGELMKTNHDRGMPSIAEQYARAVIAADREKNK